jgi:serine/threonine protein kinase
MRRILVDASRTRNARKRGGDIALVGLADGIDAASEPSRNVVAVDDALTALSHLAAPAWQDAAAALTTGSGAPAAMVRDADSGAGSALLEEGTRLGPYEVGAPIGAGGMGTVYRARDTRLGRKVAIKVLSAIAAPDCGPVRAPRSSSPRPGSSRRRRFEQEARATSSLNHPHICALHDIGCDDGTEYLVMEFLEGETLAERLARGPLPVGAALDLGLQIAGALAAAHAAGVVHGDLKPANVMLTPGQSGETSAHHAKLLDFGLARLTQPDAEDGGTGAAVAPASRSVSLSGTVLGTLPYMAPEQLRGRRADTRTDIWAFGCLVCEMLTAQRSFGESSPAGVVASILVGAPAALAALPRSSSGRPSTSRCYRSRSPSTGTASRGCCSMTG